MARRRDWLVIPRMRPARPPSRFARLGRILTGWFFLVIGVIGIPLPIVNGLVLLAIGLYILKDDYVWAARTIDWLRRKMPKQAANFDKAERYVREKYTSLKRSVRRRVYEVRR